jgi:hypothetical protein
MFLQDSRIRPLKAFFGKTLNRSLVVSWKTGKFSQRYTDEKEQPMTNAT